MTTYFPLFLLIATSICGVITLIDTLCWRKRRQQLKKEDQKAPFIIENARSFFPLLLLVLVIRSFIGQPSWVPSESLEPSLVPGDFLLVTKYNYGLRLPVWHKKIWDRSSPKRGDIVVFRWPVNPKLELVKRVVGIPGDKISYVDKILYINGKVAEQTFVADEFTNDGSGNQLAVKKYQEDLFGKKHFIYRRSDTKIQNFYHLTVPEGMYFMMGDNRDNSDDSRYWGFMPENTIVGKASLIFMSWKQGHFGINWRRIGTVL